MRLRAVRKETTGALKMGKLKPSPGIEEGGWYFHVPMDAHLMRAIRAGNPDAGRSVLRARRRGHYRETARQQRKARQALRRLARG